MARVALGLVVVLASATAAADDEEAYVIVDAGPAVLNVGHVHGGDQTATVAGAAANARVAYGLSDVLALEVAFGGMVGLNAEYHDVPMAGGDIHFFQDVVGFRTTVGASARFGARWVPTVSLHAGYQQRMLVNAMKHDGQFQQGALPSATQHELVTLGSVGLELRLDRHWHVGISAQAALGVGAESGFLGVEVPLRLGYAWYPGLFRSAHVTRFED